MPWFGRPNARKGESPGKAAQQRPLAGLPVDADARLKEMVLRQDVEIGELEAVQKELISTLVSLMNAIGQISGAGFQVTPLASEARTLRTPEEAVMLRESLRDLLFESCLAPIQGDERDALHAMVRLLLDELRSMVGDWGALAPEVTALRDDIAREENRSQLDGAVVRLKDILFRLAVLTRGLTEERDGLKALVSASLTRLRAIAESMTAVPGGASGDWRVRVDAALETGNIAEAKSALEDEGARLAQEVARLGTARVELTDLLAQAEQRIRSLEDALQRTDVVLDVDPETGLGTRRALEALLADPASRPRWVLVLRIANAAAIGERYGAVALGRVLRALVDRAAPLVPDARGQFRLGAATLGVTFATADPAALSAKGEAIAGAVEQTRFLFRSNVVSVHLETEVMEVPAGNGPVALLAEA